MSSSTSTDQKAQNHGFTAANQSKWAGKDGHFRRQQSTFRDEIKKGGKFEPELNRYILLVAEACPWAHRTMIVRKLKGMDKVDGLLPCYIVNSILAEEGWSWVPYESRPGAGVPGTGLVPGHEDKKRIRGFYLAADPEYSARCTVPVIWDNKTNTIVNNESSEIIRFMNTCFDDFLPADKKGLTFYPEKLEKEINELNDYAYNNFNNGVYKSGFATSKEAYESSVGPVFETLDHLEKLLSDGRTYFIGNQLTETDIRLYTTAVRFDPVYHLHFKCNFTTIRDGYPLVDKWMRNLYWNHPAFKETTNFDSIKSHYMESHLNINPNGIVAKGPVPHIRPL